MKLYDTSEFNKDIFSVIYVLENTFGEPFENVLVIKNNYIEITFNESRVTDYSKMIQIWELFGKSNNILFDDYELQVCSITQVRGYARKYLIEFNRI